MKRKVVGFVICVFLLASCLGCGQKEDPYDVLIVSEASE